MLHPLLLQFNWGLKVMAEDPSCRLMFDGMKQRLLLTLAQFKSSTGHEELVDLLWKVPPRISVDDARRILQVSIKQSSLRLSVDDESSSSSSQVRSGVEQECHLLRLPVDPQVKIGGIDYRKVEVKRSAEAPIFITCTGVNREEEESEVTANSSVTSQRNTWSNRTQKLPHYRFMYKRDDLRKDWIVQNIINVMYLILKRENTTGYSACDIPRASY
ncbi:hypothetical protein PsorP6_005264 [Peronosclerospora sorghi]|uniref:Uncharacterized protein n=1 Tax=Peronosclerospora sorghi TaxID=230839 RepID=A0ACC0W3Q7_9STRA|nr:hypothetical protein PsorP6_005264 [Peronosclerospora sorghi]